MIILWLVIPQHPSIYGIFASICHKKSTIHVGKYNRPVAPPLHQGQFLKASGHEWCLRRLCRCHPAAFRAVGMKCWSIYTPDGPGPMVMNRVKGAPITGLIFFW